MKKFIIILILVIAGTMVCYQLSHRDQTNLIPSAPFLTDEMQKKLNSLPEMESYLDSSLEIRKLILKKFQEEQNKKRGLVQPASFFYA